jgi:hypothetical protein
LEETNRNQKGDEGNLQKQRIKSLCDNKSKKKEKIIQEIKELFFKKGLENG